MKLSGLLIRGINNHSKLHGQQSKQRNMEARRIWRIRDEDVMAELTRSKMCHCGEESENLLMFVLKRKAQMHKTQKPKLTKS